MRGVTKCEEKLECGIQVQKLAWQSESFYRVSIFPNTVKTHLDLPFLMDLIFYALDCQTLINSACRPVQLSLSPSSLEKAVGILFV